jgi:5-methylcytosine-specific restriction endonuclease McrA
MPKQLPTFKPARFGASRAKRDEIRPNAAARGYCNKAHRQWRLAVLMRDNYQCQHCGKVDAHNHADHVIPVVLGTTCCNDGRSRYDLTAGQCLCGGCHARKTLREARGGA